MAFSRRQFVAASVVVAGFTRVTGAIAEDTLISTDEVGLTAGPVQIKVRDGTLPGYRAKPASGVNAPLVLVVQEVFGVHEHIKDVCRRLAKLGFYALAPELYFRQGDVSQIADFQALMPIVRSVPDAQVMADLDESVAWARQDGAHSQQLAITGFCWGGRIVWLYAAHSNELDAGIAWYGRLRGDASELQPTHPIDVVGDLKAPVLGLYGGADSGIPNEDVEAMQKALKNAGKNSEIVLYPDTPHAFHADYRASYRAKEALDGWQRLQTWLQRAGLKGVGAED